MHKTFSKPLVLLALVALVFFYLTAWLGTPPGAIWNSPDETANAFWAERVAERKPLMLLDEAVGLGEGVVHPRSFGVRGLALVPGSFPGLFLLYGGLKFLTHLPLSAMTPILTAVAGLVLYALFRRLFGKEIALLSAVLFYLHPAVIYYSGRGLFHNVLFVDLLIFAVGLFVLRPFSKGLSVGRWTDDLLAGVALGFAVMTRMSEVVWVLPAALVFLPFLGRGQWRRVLGVALGGLLPLFILLTFNVSIYGSYLGSAYTVPEVPPVGDVVPGIEGEDGGSGTALLPFGLHPRLIVLHGMDYGLEIFWWYSLAGILGLTVFLMDWRGADRRKRTYLFTAAAVTVWLLVLYGSWYIRDHYDPTQVTIGTSYVRYFLPIYVLTLPWVAGGLLWAAERLGSRKRLVIGLLVALIAILSLRVAVVKGDESLLEVRETLKVNLEKRSALLRHIPHGAVVVTDRFDKVLFPDRMRIIPVLDDTAFKAIPRLMKFMPVYWYGVAPTEGQVVEWSEKAWEEGLVFTRLESPFVTEGLFEFSAHGQE